MMTSKLVAATFFCILASAGTLAAASDNIGAIREGSPRQTDLGSRQTNFFDARDAQANPLDAFAAAPTQQRAPNQAERSWLNHGTNHISAQ